MSEAQKLKHTADRETRQNAGVAAAYSDPTKSSLDAAASSPDGLGAWEGGTAALKGSRSWVSEKSHAQRTADAKNTPGIDYASKITHRQDSDFNEIHTDANGQFWLYNHKTNAWDIEGDSNDIPYYHNGTELLGYNVKTGKWDVPVIVEYEGDEPSTEVYFDADAIERNTVEALTDVNPEVVG